MQERSLLQKYTQMRRYHEIDMIPGRVEDADEFRRMRAEAICNFALKHPDVVDVYNQLRGLNRVA